MTWKLKSEKSAKKMLYKNKSYINLLYLNSEGIPENFEELFISIFRISI